MVIETCESLSKIFHKLLMPYFLMVVLMFEGSEVSSVQKFVKAVFCKDLADDHLYLDREKGLDLLVLA